ncbi:MAG: class II aldolase/adducin family protein [Armatimonadota bacterium]|nr:class II aldolase/adducin family protein [Armatimonadota bacterium]MDR7451831.1 class II aldolase/adducin family protein [Armatimonadota bacterium]MDR7467556.1 class II aldolase/adducin family protein [Armatimonadota bacterium]MDR7494483.1 class II aldolase/adducin family protein [Armatimonadota bacterium]MDR7499744.1 class II aldolase/adducin family protein [Armatimonadota bacterium]
MGASDLTVDELRAELVRVAHRAFDLGLTLGISGNLSVRVPDSDRIVIKATGVSMGDMTVEDTLLLDLAGRVLEASPRRPSKERFFHLAIYRARPDVGAVSHLHPPHVLAFAALHRLPPLLTGASRTFLGGKLALVRPAPSGSQELADLVGQAFSNPAIVAAILAEHGSVTVGPDLRQAFYLSQYLEDAARTALLVDRLRQMG